MRQPVINNPLLTNFFNFFDIFLGHDFQTTSTNSWSHWLIGLNEKPPSDPKKIADYLKDTFNFITRTNDLENHIKGLYMSLIVRLAARSWLTCKDEILQQDFEEVLEAATEKLVQYTGNN